MHTDVSAIGGLSIFCRFPGQEHERAWASDNNRSQRSAAHCLAVCTVANGHGFGIGFGLEDDAIYVASARVPAAAVAGDESAAICMILVALTTHCTWVSMTSRRNFASFGSSFTRSMRCFGASAVMRFISEDVLWDTITTLGMMIANVPAVLLGERIAGRMPVKLVHRLAAAIFAGSDGFACASCIEACALPRPKSF